MPNKPTMPPANPVKPKNNMPEGMRLDLENAAKDRKVRKEREAYDEYDKTRLKDQGKFFKHGGTVSKRAKRFEEGGNVEEMKRNIAANQEYSAPMYEKAEEKDLSPAKTTRQRFNAAYAKNRGSDKPFEFEGKMYRTAAMDKKAAKPAAKSVDDDEGEAERRMAAIGDAYKKAKPKVPEATAEQMARRSKQEKEQALETVNPEDFIGATALLRALPKLAARAAAKSGPKDLPKAFQKREPYYESKADVARRPRDMDEVRFADDGNPNFKHGGKVKKMASGGMAKSASSRADGCAIRGKTRA